jgi:hypothetical protein
MSDIKYDTVDTQNPNRRGAMKPMLPNIKQTYSSQTAGANYSNTAPSRLQNADGDDTFLDSGLLSFAPRTAPAQSASARDRGHTSSLNLPIISSSVQFQNERLMLLLSLLNDSGTYSHAISDAEMDAYQDISAALNNKFDSIFI